MGLSSLTRYNLFMESGDLIESGEGIGGIIRMCEQVAASGNTLILYSA